MIERTSTPLRRPGSAAVVLAAVTLILLACGSFSTNLRSFSDDFDGPLGVGPDPTKWTFDIGAGGWGNNELQYYTESRENSFLDGNGHLVIRATRSDGPQVVYRSARLTTRGLFAQRYGRWEARMKITSKPGMWPAWWMLGDNFGTDGWPACGEIDVLEDYGHSAVESSVHLADGAGGIQSYSGGLANDDQFHVFAMEWSPTGVSFSRDGVRYAGRDWAPGFDPHRPMFMVLNLAVGGDIGKPAAELPFPVDFLIDYVRVGG
jgi:beta-glucanase (GH16 family)